MESERTWRDVSAGRGSYVVTGRSVGFDRRFYRESREGVKVRGVGWAVIEDGYRGGVVEEKVRGDVEVRDGGWVRGDDVREVGGRVGTEFIHNSQCPDTIVGGDLILRDYGRVKRVLFHVSGIVPGISESTRSRRKRDRRGVVEGSDT